jgi:hypothetical protein
MKSTVYHGVGPMAAHPPARLAPRRRRELPGRAAPRRQALEDLRACSATQGQRYCRTADSGQQTADRKQKTEDSLQKALTLTLGPSARVSAFLPASRPAGSKQQRAGVQQTADSR